MKNIYKFGLLFLIVAFLAPISSKAQGLKPGDPVKGLQFSKKVELGDKYMYKIVLEAFATGESVTTTTTVTKPVDLVLALDYSSSMVKTKDGQLGDDPKDFYPWRTPTTLTYNKWYIEARGKENDTNYRTPYYYFYRGKYYEIKYGTDKAGQETGGGDEPTGDYYYYLAYNSKDDKNPVWNEFTDKFTNELDVIYTGTLYTISGKGKDQKTTAVTRTFNWSDFETGTYYYAFQGTDGPDKGKAKYGLVSQMKESITKGPGDGGPGGNPGGPGGNPGGGDKNNYVLYFVDDDGFKHYLFETGIQDFAPTNNNEDADIYWGPLWSNTRLAALQNAVIDFLQVVKEKSNGVDNRVSIVLFDGKLENPDGTYKLYDIWDNKGSINEDNLITLQGIVDGTTAGEGTYHFLALEKAYVLLEPGFGDKTRNQVVIMFTDGEPYHTGNSNDNKVKDANSALVSASKLKEEGVSLYVVSLLSPSISGQYPWLDEFMEGMSSNYAGSPVFNANGSSFTGGEKLDGANFYQQYNESQNLSQIFQAIAEETMTEGGADIELDGESTTTIDVLSDWFQLPSVVTKDDMSKIIVKVADFDGSSEIDGKTTYSWKNEHDLGTQTGENNPIKHLSDDGKTIEISNFDFSQNWVGYDTGTNTKHGKKLIIEIPIEVDPKNPGGANEFTNEATSGIYYNGEPVALFEQPTVNNPNIIIIKKGLKAGDSSLFTVSSKEDDDISVVTTCDGKISDSNNKSVSIGYIKIQRDGLDYTVTENPDWSWAYSIDEKSLSATKKVSESTEQYVYVEGGKLKFATTEDAVPATATKTFKGTVYIFENTSKTEIPDHGESIKQNVMVFTNNITVNPSK